MSEFFLDEKNASKTRLKEAENARENRAEFVSAYSQGRISRRDLVKLGLITSAGLIVPKQGLSPFATSAFGASPTGTLASPLFGARCIFPAYAPLRSSGPHADSQRDRCHTPASSREIFRPPRPTPRQIPWTLLWVGDGTDGRPSAGSRSGPTSDLTNSHRRLPSKRHNGATTNTIYNPGVASSLNSGIDPTSSIPLKFHPSMPTQDPTGACGHSTEPFLPSWHRPLRRANPVPPSQRPACRCNAERRLRTAHHIHPRAQRPPRRGE